MNELIPIRVEGGEKFPVDARKLHEFLGTKTPFSMWIVRRIEEYDFLEDRDYRFLTKLLKTPEGGRPTKEYLISIGMAKELSLIENTEKGKEIRTYFIRIEEESSLIVKQALENITREKNRLKDLEEQIKKSDRHYIANVLSSKQDRLLLTKGKEMSEFNIRVRHIYPKEIE
jgi:phage anti-repressor protein